MMPVVYAFFPMYLCNKCFAVEGFWSDIMDWIPYNGMFVQMRFGYWRAVWYWFFPEIELPKWTDKL